MANEQVIDQVINTEATTTQVTTLTKLLSDLDIQMADDIKTANQLNAVLANSKSFSDYNKNATAAAIQLEKVQQAQNKTAQSTATLNEVQAKAAAAQQSRDDKAAIALQKKLDQQAAADAKQIAMAEAKAAKLQAIQDEESRKASVQFPEAKEQPLAITENTGSGIAASDANAAFAASQTGMQIPLEKTTEDIAAENAAMLEQQEVLGSLTVAQRASIENLLALQAERAANTAELKALTVEDAASGERMVYLTAEQVRLKIAISEVTVALNRQTKEALAADGAMTQLDQSVLLLRTAYEQLSVAERESEQGQTMLAELNALDAENKRLALTVGNTSKQIGDYEKAQSKASIGTQLADRVANQFTRSIIRMGVQFLLIGAIFGAITWLYDYIKALDMFNPIADAATRAQKGLSEAFSSNEYQKGIENVETLASDLDLVKKGLLDQDSAINQYNETLGKTFGYVDNINDAQKEFIKNKNAYIQTIIDEAAAQDIANDAAKEVADLAKRNYEIQLGTSNAQKKLSDLNKVGRPGTGQGQESLDEAKYQTQKNIDANNAEVAANKAKIDQITQNAISAMDNVRSGEPNKGKKSGGSDGVSDELNGRMNAELERQKQVDQEKINNDKLSYDERIKAANDFYTVSKQIQDNNENNALSKLTAADSRRKDIVSDGLTKLSELQIQHSETMQKLRDEQYKQDQQILKNNIEKQRDLFKQVAKDPNQSYDMKLIALKMYEDKSMQLIKANYDEEKNEAGQNAESLKLAKQNQAKAELELTNQTAEERLRIIKENLQKILEASKESEQDAEDATKDINDKVMISLTNKKDAKIRELDKQRSSAKIDEKKYNDELLAINDAFNIAKIAQELQTAQTVVALRKATKDGTVLKMQNAGDSKTDIDKYSSSADKGIETAQNTVDVLTNNLNNALTKQDSDQSKKNGNDKLTPKEIAEKSLDDAVKAVDEIDKLRQKAYEAEISRLEKIGQQIDKNADNEKIQVQNSIASSATKARENAVIDAQAAAQHEALQARINQEKHKEDVAEKEAAIAKIAIQGALAIVKAAPNPVTVALTSALVALELGTAVAQKLPTYAKGTKNYPGGYGIWGEAGIERATLPDGSVQYSPDAPTLANFPRGTVITPHMDLMRQIKPEPVKNYAGGQQVGWGEVLKQLKKMEQPQRQRSKFNITVEMNFELYKQQYLNR